MIADDYPDAAETVAMLLTFLGHVCKTARSGTAALALAERHEFDIAILDIGMPDITGYEVARRLRASLQPSIYLAALTAWNGADDRRRAIEAGFDLHVTKPADQSKLASILTAASAARRRRDGLKVLTF